MLLGKAMLALLVAMGPSGGVSKEQLNYSKKLFAEGDEAMTNKDFKTALVKFQEAYRYAPHLHVFNFNIASAAEQLKDCKMARTYYQRFVDLVPEHPERNAVKAKIKSYGNECLADADSSDVVTKKSAKKRQANREEEEASRAMNEALFQIRVAHALYHDGKKRLKGKTKVFWWPALRKKWNARRMTKLMPKHGVDEDGREVPQPEMPAEKTNACRIAKIQENRVLRALQDSIDRFDTQESYRVLSRFLRGAKKDLDKFKTCGS